jgi:hypothetical protein
LDKGDGITAVPAKDSSLLPLLWLLMQAPGSHSVPRHLLLLLLVLLLLLSPATCVQAGLG